MSAQTTMDDHSSVATPPRLVGNRLVLAGAGLYFAEWVGIVGAGGMNVWFPAGTRPATVLAGYLGHREAFGWAAGWLSVALLGRVVYAVGLRDVLRRSASEDPFSDIGVSAATIGVVLEVISCGVAAGVALAAANHASASQVASLDNIALAVENLIWGPIGVMVLALSVAMLRSRLFPLVLSALGLAAGTALTLAGLAFSAPSYAGVHDALNAAVPLAWIWMVWTGVLTARRAGRRA